MLSYNARYYDATIGRFVSADTIVPGSASGGMDGIAVKPLTVDFHEGGFQSKLNQENGLGFWFQLSDKQRQQAGSPWGPANAQALNRYSYVQNNPLRWTDPHGHWTFTLSIGAEIFGGPGFRGSISASIDSEGTVAIAISGGATAHANYGGGFGPTISVTDAPQVADLEGNSLAVGVQGGEGIGLSVEETKFKSNNIEYHGATFGTSATLKGIPVDGYVAGDKTKILAQLHPLSFVKQVYSDGVNRLNQYLRLPL